MQAVKDASPLYEVERRAEHAARPGFRITELQISKKQKVPWHYHNNVQDTFYVLQNVCPNCGGGFMPRPVRPSKNLKGDNYLGKDPASTKVKHRPVDPAAHAKFAAPIKGIAPEKR